MNSYFASVEQELQPRLRGRPVGVVPLEAETTCCIAASYEAKAYGVKTGTRVADARRMCPGIQFVKSRTAEYVRMHHQIVAAVNTVLPVEQVHSIDEMSCQLLGREQQEERAIELGKAVKQAIRDQAGSTLKCSVGLAPNRLLAKVASDIKKPNGLTLIRAEDLPHCLYSLELDDFPGIGSRMLLRLRQAGIFTTQQLCEASQRKMKEIWGGVVGERWWFYLRGENLVDLPTQRRTVGHSHVLGPERRTVQGAYEVLAKLTHKAAVRLRKMNYWAGKMTITVNFLGRTHWHETVKLGDIQDTQTMLGALEKLWRSYPPRQVPFKVAITLHELKSSQSCAMPLFPEQTRRIGAARAMDAINKRMGEGALYLGAMHNSRDTAPDRIAFQSIPECGPQHNENKSR